MIRCRSKKGVQVVASSVVVVVDFLVGVGVVVLVH